MEVFRLIKDIGEWPKGTLGIFETVELDSRMTLKMKCDGDGYWTKVEVPQDEIEETEYRVDTFSNEIIAEGFLIRDEWYTNDPHKCLEICQGAGYSNLKEAYEDDYYFWTVWEEEEPFPNNLKVEYQKIAV